MRLRWLLAASTSALSQPGTGHNPAVLLESDTGDNPQNGFHLLGLTGGAPSQGSTPRGVQPFQGL